MAGKTVSRQELYDEIWTISASKAATKYEISYSRFLKICRENNIPIPPSGYWTKLQCGKPVEKTPLPPSKIETVELIPEKGKPKETEEIISQQTIVVPEEEKIGLEIRYEGQAQRYNRETLYQEVWAEPMTVVCQRYGMSDNGLRKICRKLDVPFPPAGYWAKVRAGKTVSKPSLPKVKTPPNEDRPKTGERRQLHVEETALSFLKTEDRNKIIDAASKLRVAGPGAHLHKNIASHKAKCEGWLERQKERGQRYGRYVEDPPILAADISKESYSRAFHILDALLKGMLPFGASLTYQFHFQVNGEDVPFSMSESKDQIPHAVTQDEKMVLLKYEEAKRKNSWASKPNIPKWEHPWNGRLTLIINGKYKFMDCKSYSLEDRIGEIMIAFYEASYAVRLQRLEAEEKRRKEEEERKRAEEIRARYNTEIDYTEGLINAAEDYDTACKLRAYIAAVKAAGQKSEEWIEWANAKADWLDPTVHAEDPYFGVRQHTNSTENKMPKRKGYW